MASDELPDPAAFRNLSGMILTFQLTPETPAPLLPTAPIVPATWVPWLLSSNGSLSSETQSQPRQSSTRPSTSSSIPFERSAQAVVGSDEPQFSPGLTHCWGARSG